MQLGDQVRGLRDDIGQAREEIRAVVGRVDAALSRPDGGGDDLKQVLKMLGEIDHEIGVLKAVQLSKGDVEKARAALAGEGATAGSGDGALP